MKELRRRLKPEQNQNRGKIGRGMRKTMLQVPKKEQEKRNQRTEQEKRNQSRDKIGFRMDEFRIAEEG